MRGPKINFLTVVCLIAIVGCSNPMKRSAIASTEAPSSTEESRVSLVSASEPDVMTFLDSQQLQYDTGQMDDNADQNFQMTSSGLKYRVLRKSKKRKPTASNTVTVHYRGWLDSGREFDSSYKRGEPISFPLSGVVKGWTEGMQLVGEGGMIELWLPSRLGYGAQGSPPSVPPYANLHFIVELISVQ